LAAIVGFVLVPRYATPHFSTGFWDFFVSPKLDNLHRVLTTVYVPSTTFHDRQKSGKII